MSRDEPSYQAEIDGLRAFAIVPVVLFHAGLPGMRAGFLGVDVFFVISGFLITRMLLAELARTGSIDLWAFYARRVRRLLPALATVVAATLLLGMLVLTAAGERQDLAASALASLGFVANVYFWRSQANYAAPAADWIPLLNMWTLAVEEQFYLVWPALILLAAAAARRAGRPPLHVIAALLLAGLAASLLLFVWGTRALPTATFYLAPTRAWELAIGGALALSPGLPARLAGGTGPLALAAIGLAGLALMIAPMAGRAWGLVSATLPVTIGTALVLLAILAAPGAPTSRLLRLPPLVVIGRLSYAWYLWHWPLLALARIHGLDLASPARDLAIGIGALAPAALTYLLIENPIRRRRPWPFSGERQTLAAGAALSLALAGLAVGLHLHADAALRNDAWLGAIVAAERHKVEAPCSIPKGFTQLAPAGDCLVGAPGAPPRVLVWGDSHAQHFVEMVRTHAAQNGYAAVTWTKSACAPLLAGLTTDCRAFNAAVMRELPHLASRGVTGLLLASAHFGYGRAATEAQQVVAGARVRVVLAAARSAGLRVLVVPPVPTFRLPMPRCLAHATPERCGHDRATLAEARADRLAALERIVAESPGVRLWDPWPEICSATMCTPVRDGTILYADHDHLSRAGSRLLAPAAAPHLDWLRE